ncbi:MAG: alpha/beta hydrolase [Planctomycetes bacterium]|nr:alpha/beta hydrolase [Planctomycetota bacterium]
MTIGSIETGTNLFRFNTTEAVARITPRPVMIIHGTEDRVVPIEQGEMVFSAAENPKSFHAVRGAGHCETIAVEGRRYTDRMIKFLDDALSSGTPGMPGAK